MVGLKTAGKGLVAPGSPVSSLVPGKYKLTITQVVGENDGLIARDVNGDPVLQNGKEVPAISEHQMVTVEYPGEFIKSHQVKDIPDLMEKVTTQLRNRYGIAGNINVAKTPAALAADMVIDIEVTGA